MRITGAQVLDLASGTFQRRDLAIADGRLVDPSTLPADAPRVDLDGAYLLPGFFDCHVHICSDTFNTTVNGWQGALPGKITLWAALSARRMLMSGITTARECGGWDYHEIAVRNAIRDGWIAGSRLFCSGRILSQTSATQSYFPGMYEICDGPQEVTKAARKQLAQGADLIKILASGCVISSEYERADAIQLQPEEISAAVRIASENFKFVAAHAHAPQAIINAAKCGCRSVEHTCHGTPDAYAAMKAYGTYLVPTVCATQAALKDPAMAETTPAHVMARFAALCKQHCDNIRLAHEMGITLCMGTDAGTPGNHAGENMQEVELMVNDCGLTPLEAIRTATVNAAEMMGLEDRLGRLDNGLIADVIAVDRNPLEDVSALRKVFFVMKDGQVFRNDRSFRTDPDGLVIV